VTVYLKELFNFVVISPKRKQALLESNLPAIRLMTTMVGQCGAFAFTLLFNKIIVVWYGLKNSLGLL
jgi:hypothetical protein